MAKKTSSNAISKVNDQITKLESSKTKKSGTKTVKTSPVKKGNKKSSSVPKKTTKTKQESVIVVPEKKKSPAKKTNKKTPSSKNVRGGIVAPKKKRVTKKTNSEVSSVQTEKEKIEIVVPRETETQELLTEEIQLLEETSIHDSVVDTPRFILEEKPVEDVDHSSQDKSLKDFFPEEDSSDVSTSELSLDDVDVIKFDSETEKTSTKKNRKLKKRADLSNTKILKLDKLAELEKMDQLEEYYIEKDKVQVVPTRQKTEPKKYEFSRKRKGKGYIVHIPKKQSFQELESDLRDLYDKVNDVVKDLDENVEEKGKTSVPKKKTRKKFDLSSVFKKKEKRVVKTKKVKERPVEERIPGERPSLLDHISQKVLNVFVTILSIIFMIMVIAFIGFIIYVSTF